MEEWTIAELLEAYKSGSATVPQVVGEFLTRIEELDSSGVKLNSIIQVNPKAMAEAQRCQELLESGSTLELLGVPILLKDNIDTDDGLETTAGSLALVGVPCAEDAPLVQRLRDAGAIILAKTNLSEWANFRSTRSTSGWSSRGGQTRNPHALDRTPCGSSSGSAVAVAANLALAAVGTETDGSITCPAAHSSIVGFKPSSGVVSQKGIIPIAASQDTAGPMARTLEEALALLRVMAEPGVVDLSGILDSSCVKGARLGVIAGSGDFHHGVTPVWQRALESLERAGAELVEVDFHVPASVGENELKVLLYEFKAGLNAYLAARPGGPSSIEELIAYNAKHSEGILAHFGQEYLEQALACGGLEDPEYIQARDENKRLMGPEGISALLKSKDLSALIAPTNGPAWLIDWVNGDSYSGGGVLGSPAAVAGYPHVTVPMGDYRGLPLGLSIVGDWGKDFQLLNLAYAFEQLTQLRRIPLFANSADS